MSKLAQHWQLRWDSISPRRDGAGSSYAFLDHKPFEKWEKSSDSPRKCSLDACSLRRSRTQPLLPTFRPAGDEKPGSLGSVPITWASVVHFQGKSVCFLHEASGHPLCPTSSVPQSCAESRASPPGDGYYLAVGGAVAQHNWSHITTVLQDRRFRCQLVDSSEDLGLISVQGPAR